MALTKSMVSEFPWAERYGVLDVDNVLTPALRLPRSDRRELSGAVAGSYPRVFPY